MTAEELRAAIDEFRQCDRRSADNGAVLVPLEKVRANEFYADLADLAVIFNHRIIADKSGHWRWERNDLMRFLCNRVSLNDVAVMWQNGAFTDEEVVKYYMQIGYSLDGFMECFTPYGMHENDMVKDMIEKHKGEVLRL